MSELVSCTLTLGRRCWRAHYCIVPLTAVKSTERALWSLSGPIDCWFKVACTLVCCSVEPIILFVYRAHCFHSPRAPPDFHFRAKQATALSRLPRVGPGHPSFPPCPFTSPYFPLFTFLFLSLALLIFFFCPSLLCLPE